MYKYHIGTVTAVTATTANKKFMKIRIPKTEILQAPTAKLVPACFEIDLQSDLLCSQLLWNSWHSIRIARKGGWWQRNEQEREREKYRHKNKTTISRSLNAKCYMSQICRYMFRKFLLKLIVCACMCVHTTVFVHTWWFWERIKWSFLRFNSDTPNYDSSHINATCDVMIIAI